MTRARVREWIAAYECAWRTPGVEPLAAIFTEDASYRQGPFREPVTGLPAIARMWEGERDGPGEVFQLTSEIIAVEGHTAVARIEVTYGDPVHQVWLDLWILHFADDGRCRSFEEWPFAPGTPAAQ